MPDDGLIGTQLGAYRIQGELGSGGMGSVYRAEAVEAGPGLASGDTVALKVMHPNLLELPGFFRRFMLEAELGKRVRHPKVVRTYDADAIVHDGQHYHFLVMEYVEGKSLRELLNELGRIPEALLREIALQTAAGLAAIHAEGIVHRDIKPENVLITDDHDVRVMDLGVAKLRDADLAITTPGWFAGSLTYAAPEHFSSDDVTTSADLYSLGAMLHELATCEHPFQQDDAAALIHAHLSHVPPRLADSGDTSDFFSELVACLLAKKPEERFESAAVLEDVVARGEQAPWWTDLATRVRKPDVHLPEIRVRKDTRLHGRETELSTLHAAWDRARAGDGNAVLIEGEAGIGKTRLVDAFLREIESSESHVLYGAYAPSGGMGAISDALLAKFGEGGFADAIAPYLTVTPLLVPAFAAVIRRESPPPGAEPLGGDAFAAVCVHLMRALAEEKPLIWIVEDLNFASEEGRDLALALVRAAEHQRALLLFTARPGVAIEEASRLPNYQRIIANRLGAREVFELLEEALQNDTLAEKLGGKIAKKSDGVPFFVFEMIRGLTEAEFIRREPDGRYVQTSAIEKIEVPSAVKDIIDGRLGGLTGEQRRILDVGSVIGMVFDPGLIVTVLESKRIQILQQLAEIERGWGLLHGEAGHTRFDQNQIQEVLYQELPPDLRAEYHTLVADAYAARLDGDAQHEDAVFLASHHLRGSRPRDGVTWLGRALDHLEKTIRYEEAIELATLALDVPRLLEGAARAGILLRKAERHRVRGEHGIVRPILDEALRWADESGKPALRARARIAMGTHLWQTTDLLAALEQHKKAEEHAIEADDEKLRWQATGNIAVVFRGLGRYEEALAQFQASLALARDRGDKKWEAKATFNVGLVSWNLGRTDKAQACFERVLVLARETGNRLDALQATGNLGIVMQNTGRIEEARAQYERTLNLSREVGDRRSETYATGNLASILSQAGRIEEATTHFEKTLALARETGDRRGEARAVSKLGSDRARLGRFEEARSHLERSLEIAVEVGNRRQEGEALKRLARVAEAEGDGDKAQKFATDSLTVQRELGAQLNVATSLVVLARIEAARGKTTHAATLLDEALALASETKTPNVVVSAVTERARLPGGSIEAAEAALKEHKGHVDHEIEMESRFRLWELTSDEGHRDEAHRLLDFLREHAPKQDRETMVRDVPLHRAIVAACDRTC